MRQVNGVIPVILIDVFKPQRPRALVELIDRPQEVCRELLLIRVRHGRKPQYHPRRGTSAERPEGGWPRRARRESATKSSILSAGLILRRMSLLRRKQMYRHYGNNI